MRMFLTREPYLIDYTPHEQRTTRQHAFFRGYGAGMSALRLEMHGRGDLEGIPFRVAEMEQNLGLVPVQKSDTSQRQISRSYWFFEPVKIESVYLQDKPIEIDKKFAAGPDWLNGLRVRIKNTSGKRITYLSLGLEFPETASTGAMVTSTMNYGMPAHRKVPGIPDLLSATPDSVLELELADKEFAGILRILESRIPLSDLTRVNIRISMIHYDDNTGWAGHPLIQDPADPTRWLPSAK
ncbi:MAG: hypothetical protein IPM25_17230 [Chloracidobacterium sp.]|nr:hypothetical protein [Chloracidobacterium sp.]